MGERLPNSLVDLVSVNEGLFAEYVTTTSNSLVVRPLEGTSLIRMFAVILKDYYGSVMMTRTNQRREVQDTCFVVSTSQTNLLRILARRPCRPKSNAAKQGPPVAVAVSWTSSRVSGHVRANDATHHHETSRTNSQEW